MKYKYYVTSFGQSIANKVEFETNKCWYKEVAAVAAEHFYYSDTQHEQSDWQGKGIKLVLLDENDERIGSYFVSMEIKPTFTATCGGE